MKRKYEITITNEKIIIKGNKNKIAYNFKF